MNGKKIMKNPNDALIMLYDRTTEPLLPRPFTRRQRYNHKYSPHYLVCIVHPLPCGTPTLLLSYRTTVSLLQLKLLR